MSEEPKPSKKEGEITSNKDKEVKIDPSSIPPQLEQTITQGTAPTPMKTQAPQAPPVTPEMQKMNEALRKLMEINTQLVIKVATCRCKDRHKCPVFLKAQDIAVIIDELQEMRKEGLLGGGQSG